MTIARGKIVNLDVTRLYHCISRCVRRAHLMDDQEKKIQHQEVLVTRKTWISQRLEFLQSVFTISVGGFATMDNHLHTLLSVECENAKGLSDREVARRWFLLAPPKDKKRKLIEVDEAFLDERCRDASWVAKMRSRLSSISWFMKYLKEPLARLANKQDNCKGTFFEGRFKSIAILDEESLLATCAYIDLNPVAAGIADTPETSQHTSLRLRIDHVRGLNRLGDLAAAIEGSVQGQRRSAGLEEGLWVLPIEDRQGIDSQRRGMFRGITLGQFTMLVDMRARQQRLGKVSIDSGLPEIFTRLQTSFEQVMAKIDQLQSEHWYGNFFASCRGRLREVAIKLGMHHLSGIAKCTRD